MDLEAAMRNRELEVWYQPQVRLDNGALAGAEALVRWRRQGRVLPPSAFVPALEADGRIVALDEAVLGLVCADLAKARQSGLSLGPVSVNLSRRQLGRTGAADRLAGMVRRYGVPPQNLVFELTESALCCDDRSLLEALPGRLRTLGFATSLDDFGMGFSSLKLLADHSFDILKLDRYFVGRIGESRAEAILSAVMDLGRQLGAGVIAEGVETPEQAAFLRARGCPAAQGYLFYKPMPRAEFFALAAKGGRSH